MIEAELHGKSHVAEDRLTSTCLGLLRLLPDSYLLEFLGKAVTLENQLLAACSFDLVEKIKFWPYLRNAGEPDAAIRLRRNGDPNPLTLIVEAKHGAGKSGFEPTAEEIESANASARTENVSEILRPRDQLAKYLRAGKREYQQVGLIYLTHHRSMPREDIDESVKVAGGAGIIYWLSWFDLYTFTVDRLESGRLLEFSAQKILEDIRRYLEFQGYARFRRWISPPAAVSANLPRYGRSYRFGGWASLHRALYCRDYFVRVSTGLSGVIWLGYSRSK